MNNFYYDFMVIIRVLVICTGVVDAIKYRVETSKVKKTASSRDLSRKFTLMALICNIILILYCLLISEWTLLIVRCMSLIFMCELFWTQYLYYPYKMRKLMNFRKPNFFIFLWNALLPNRIRKRL